MINTIDPREFRTTLGQFATGVTVITTRDSQGRPVGVTASSFNSVSLDPPLVLWSLDKSAASLQAFADHQHFSVHVLAAGQESLSNKFARRGEDKFADIHCETGIADVPLLADCAARFQCKLTYQYEGGDHIILVGEVLEYKNFARRPLIFHSGAYARAKPAGTVDTTLQSVLDYSKGCFTSDFLGYLISRAHYQLHLPLLQEIAAINLKELHYFVLSALSVKNVMALADMQAFLAHTGLCPNLDDCREMQALGLLSIVDSGELALRITEAGKMTYIKLLSGDVDRGQNALSDFTPEELNEFIFYLRKVIDKTDPGVPDLWS
jgi:3-hydroxy-9,10-secoandrosta-1,3,5(10)-triene-9,17-dione monooxygenase reductase component